MQHILEPLDDGYGFQIASEEDHTNQPLHDDLNWSTVDTDAPYHLCSVCELLVVNEICSMCTYYIRGFLDDNDSIISWNPLPEICPIEQRISMFA